MSDALHFWYTFRMTTSLNWPTIAAEAVRYLQDLLRIDTTNPPGNELAAAEYLARVLHAEGYEPIVLEAAPPWAWRLAPWFATVAIIVGLTAFAFDAGLSNDLSAMCNDDDEYQVSSLF